jgi:hypothetical protein
MVFWFVKVTCLVKTARSFLTVIRLVQREYNWKVAPTRVSPDSSPSERWKGGNWAIAGAMNGRSENELEPL